MREDAPMRLQAVLVLALLIQAQPTYALDAPGLVDRHVEALGGKAKIDAISSLRLGGKITFSFGDQAFELLWSRTTRKPGMVREEASLQGLTAISAHDGQDAWSIQPFEGRREPDHMSADDSKELEQSSEVFGPLVAAKE